MLRLPLLLLVVLVYTVIQAQTGLTAYSNYDFIPGDKVVFEDDFTSAVDGEFSPLWKLVNGQAVVNKLGENMIMIITEGNYGIVKPRIKTAMYLDGDFTVECDFIAGTDDGSGINIFLPGDADDNSRGIHFDNTGNIETMYFPESGDLRAEYRESESVTPGTKLHLAIVYKKGQMKCYVNQSRVLVIPEVDYTPHAVMIGGVAPVRFTNIRIAEGGGMNMLDKLYKDGKLITHGITFEKGKATIKSESMGTINEIVKILQTDVKIKLSIEGHTDSDGDEKANQLLSEKRAESVKNLLVELKTDGNRLLTKGFGEIKPIADNNTVEGKANNRRVEFVLVK